MDLRVFGVAIAACTALLLGTAASASAGTLDQQQTSAPTNAGLAGNPPGGSNQSLAQTFTAGITGGLDQVDVSLLKVGTPPASVTLEIRSTVAGQPGPASAVLGTASIPTAGIGGSLAFVPVTLPAPVAVTAGTQYAIVLYMAAAFGNTVGWGVNNAGNLYAGGQQLVSTQPLPPNDTWSPSAAGDQAFKTYVVPRPPATPVTGSTPGPQATAPKCKKKKKRANGKPKAAAAAKCKKKKKKKKKK